MAKNRNKNKNKKNKGGGVVSMDTSDPTNVSYSPQAMDTSETGNQIPAIGGPGRKIKKGRPMKRSIKARKMKAIAKAISKNEMASEKVVKSQCKKMNVQSAKLLYD